MSNYGQWACLSSPRCLSSPSRCLSSPTDVYPSPPDVYPPPRCLSSPQMFILPQMREFPSSYNAQNEIKDINYTPSACCDSLGKSCWSVFHLFLAVSIRFIYISYQWTVLHSFSNWLKHSTATSQIVSQWNQPFLWYNENLGRPLSRNKDIYTALD